MDDKNCHKGHRSRLRTKLKLIDSDNIESHELLEFLLFCVMKRKNTNNIAHRLLSRFNNSITDVLNASVEELTQVDGIGIQAAMFLRSIPALSKLYLHSKRNDNFRITLKNFKDYCTEKSQNMKPDTMLIVHMNASGGIIGENLIDDISLSDDGLVNMRKILSVLINSKAAAMFIIHKHNFENKNINESIISNITSLSSKLKVLNIPLIDYVIISDTEYISLRDFKSED